ncbi:MAG: hypothetical protein LQ345_005267 [Seirophora villosa]|nr:MAG: hypothetical protein LQ345_005267 [Seirophora villosa]
MANGLDSTVMIEDIRQNDIGPSILDELRHGLHPAAGGEKKLPTLLLYDEKGLKLFEEISYLDAYYLTNTEIEILRNHASDIARKVPNGCMILELGSGNLRKVEILLNALELASKRVDYFALDLSEPELQRTLSAVPKHYRHVRCYGLLGTYDDGLAWLARSENVQRPKWILSLGSSIGNFGRHEAAIFLQGFASTLQTQDVMLVGLDACQNEEKVHRAYNDEIGKTHEFVLNGLLHANRLLGKDVFKLKDWKVIGEYDEASGRHQAFYSPVRGLVIDGAYIEAGERIRVEESYKYSPVQRDELWRQADVVPQACFGNRSNDYLMSSDLHLLAKSTPDLPLHPAEYAKQPVPSLEEFKQLWSLWDLVTRKMIPEEELLSKPIKLRNCCIFYLGHIPTFLDIHLTKATRLAPTEPRHYHTVFERGIDPDVDNPEKCHAHSEIPDEWPPVNDILDYQARVRSRVELLLRHDTETMTREVGRALWLGFEHEGITIAHSVCRFIGEAYTCGLAMHLETLLYMLLQSDRALPPSGRRPEFRALAQDARKHALPNDWIKIPSATLTIGMNEPESASGTKDYFGWDNEEPARQVQVPSFEAKARPLTNDDYVRYLIETGFQMLPASWSMTHDGTQTCSVVGYRTKDGNAPFLDGALKETFLDGKFVKSVYGPIALEHALAWPVIASYDELAGCASWLGGRIPTADEVRSIYYHADLSKTKEAEKVQAKKIAAVNG